MKKQILILSVIISLGVISCKKKDHDMENMGPQNPGNTEITIDYAAAYVVNGESNSISVINLSTNEVTQTLKLGETSNASHGGMTMPSGITWPHHVAINSSKSILAIGAPGMDLSAGHSGGMTGMSGKVGLVDARTGKIVKVIDLPAMNHNAIFSPNGTEIWTSIMQDNGKVNIYDANSYALKESIQVLDDPAEITFSLDGTTAFVANGGSDTMSVIDVNNKKVVRQIAVGHDPVGAWAGSDGLMYVDNEQGKSISVIDPNTLTVITTIDLGFMPAVASFNKKHNELWVTDPVNGQVHYWTKMDKMYMHAGVFPAGAGAHAIAFTNDESKAYITNQNGGSVSVIDVSSHSKTKDIAVGSKPNGILIKQ